MNTHPGRFGRRLIGAVAGLALVTAACGSDDASSSDSLDASSDTSVAEATAPEAPTTADGVDAGGDVERVVSLSPTHTEMMFAIGAGDLLVAVE